MVECGLNALEAAENNADFFFEGCYAMPQYVEMRISILVHFEPQSGLCFESLNCSCHASCTQCDIYPLRHEDLHVSPTWFFTLRD